MFEPINRSFFWGKPNGFNMMPRVINNFNGPVFPPMSYNCGYTTNWCNCGSNNIFNTMLIAGAASNIFGQALNVFSQPSRQEQMYPYLDLQRQQMQQQQEYNDLRNLQSLCPDYRFSVIDGQYIARSKDGFIKADSIGELTDKIMQNTKPEIEAEVES